jgi:hypothetical protein
MEYQEKGGLEESVLIEDVENSDFDYSVHTGTWHRNLTLRY